VKGWIYVIAAALPTQMREEGSREVTMVSFLEHTPEVMTEDMSMPESNPYNYEIAYAVLIEEPHKAELEIHNCLLTRCDRYSRTLFLCGVEEAISATKLIAAGQIEEERHIASR